MVNIPPIPPLLSSTPPPIDFGDVDVLPPPNGSVEDDDFSDFLTEDDSKTNEPLPSPRPPSVCDLPKISIYDGLIPPEEEDLTNHIITSFASPKNDNISKDSENNIQSFNLTETFNFNINKKDDTKNILQDEIKELSIVSRTTESCSKRGETENLQNSLEILETESNKWEPKSETVFSKHKNLKDLTISSSNVETNCNNNNTNSKCMQNVVSIEDIIDDLSDDELYSPRTPKNFIETDNLNNYFKIEEIKTFNVPENVTKLSFGHIELKASDIIDNTESASLDNEDRKQSKSSNSSSVTQYKFDMPPLQINLNGIDCDDDFGDFADFQETHFVNNTVPVNDINFKQHNNLELNNFIDSNKRHVTETNVHTDEVVRLKVSEKVDNVTVSNQCEKKYENATKENLLDLVNVSREISIFNNKTTTGEINKDPITMKNNKKSVEEFSNRANASATFNTELETNGNNEFGNFEFSKPFFDNENTNLKNIVSIKEPKEVSIDISSNEDEFDDFVDFKPCQEAAKLDGNISPYEDNESGGEEDDDFGDFNTAEPTPTATNPTLNQTSQNTTTENPALPSKNLNERISQILQLMFNPIKNPANGCSDEPKPYKIQDIPFTSIDTAKALDYQWLISETRHSFIRSLGIDSRNILFGDHWNPSLPRFAANLSFNPLKPMKPIQSSSITGDSSSTLEPIMVNCLATAHTEMSDSKKSDTFDLNWNSSNTADRTIEGFTDDAKIPELDSTAAGILNDSITTGPVTLTIFQNSIDNEAKISTTPPISEMESVPPFSPPLSAATMDEELPITPKAQNVDDFELNELEENLKNKLNINEVVVASTFSGSFKETHIYTPSKMNEFEVKQVITTPPTLSSSPTKASPIDFDYEKAAMGVIIDETVVKKEYRDVEYNPPFTMESLSKSVTSKSEIFESNTTLNHNAKILGSTNIETSVNNAAETDDQESNDDFSEFQSVSSEITVSAATAVPKTIIPLEVPKTTTVSHGGMILSPAILIPQAISMENKKPKIEWGDSTAAINPEELARIEELFPEPKSLKSSNSSQKSTPTHQVASAPSISATVANKELESKINNDDDDWSDFVSVTVTNNASTNKMGGNNNILAKNSAESAFSQRSPIISHRNTLTTQNNSNYDDEWSEFVSSAPPSQQASTYRVPQFNSGAWQNANFYNNPLSMYHKGPLNINKSSATTHFAQKSVHNNNNNYNMLGMSQEPPNAYQQQVHVMQNFSTAPVPTPERLSLALATTKSNQFQSIGSAKVSPSIALIPDLGFVAPAVPTHTSFVNSLPKPSINAKK